MIYNDKCRGNKLKDFDIIKKIKNNTNLKIFISNFNFKLFEEVIMIDKDIFQNKEKIEIIITSYNSKEVLGFFNTINTLNKEELKNELIKLYFYDAKEINSETKIIIKELLDNKILDIKIGRTNNKETLLDNIIICENKFIIEGYFNIENKIINPNGNYYYSENNNFISKNLSLFNSNFADSYPFTNNKFDTKSLEKFCIYEILEDLFKENESKIKLRDYQLEAINLLNDNQFNGILQLATGTGKTITALMAVKEYIDLNFNYKIITIIVPYKHLISQWRKEIYNIYRGDDKLAKYNYKIIECFSESTDDDWEDKIKYNIDKEVVDEKYIFLLFVDKSYYEYIKKNRQILSSKKSILIYDEAHNITKNNFNSLKDVFESKVAGSATINSEDNEKNNMINKFFEGMNYEYSLTKAIENNFLVPYEYNFEIIDLNTDEIKQYKKIIEQIKELKNVNANGDKYFALKKEEEELFSKATKKIVKFKEQINQLEDISKTLVYCNPGKINNIKYIEYIKNEIKDVKLNCQISKITADENVEERNKIIQKFSIGEIDIITAIRCLDEGYDIPAIEKAFLLHSSDSNKEYVQRRGRILRKNKNKEKAYIYDYIIRVDNEIPDREKNRFEEYRSCALNKEDCLRKWKEIIGE